MRLPPGADQQTCNAGVQQSGNGILAALGALVSRCSRLRCSTPFRGVEWPMSQRDLAEADA